jgi:microcystin-dependent protein
MEPFIGEIKLFGGDFAPRGWFFCDGRLLQVHQFEKLFSLIQTYYGGDGASNFALPDLRGRAAVQPGISPAFKTRYDLGQPAGNENVTISLQQMPAHSHGLLAVARAANNPSPTNNFTSIPVDTVSQQPINVFNDFSEAGIELSAMNSKSIVPNGASQPVNIISPVLGINYIIAWDGIYPSRP